tara:strand:- start:58 stop:387 length:330 start_codon:yes stop_codon:yes gene_type:complete
MLSLRGSIGLRKFSGRPFIDHFFNVIAGSPLRDLRTDGYSGISRIWRRRGFVRIDLQFNCEKIVFPRQHCRLFDACRYASIGNLANQFPFEVKDGATTSPSGGWKVIGL